MSRFKRKEGVVAAIRINPKDCLGVLDLLEATGVSTSEKSFSHMVSLALSSLLEAARKQGFIPVEPDMFLYGARMGRHFRHSREEVAGNIKLALPSTGEAAPIPAHSSTVSVEVQRQAMARLQQLEEIRENEPSKWNADLMKEYADCERRAFG